MSHDPLDQLFANARTSSSEKTADVSAPLGFATRVTALAREKRSEARLSRARTWALGFACFAWLAIWLAPAPTTTPQVALAETAAFSEAELLDEPDLGLETSFFLTSP